MKLEKEKKLEKQKRKEKEKGKTEKRHRSSDKRRMVEVHVYLCNVATRRENVPVG